MGLSSEQKNQAELIRFIEEVGPQVDKNNEVQSYELERRKRDRELVEARERRLAEARKLGEIVADVPKGPAVLDIGMEAEGGRANETDEAGDGPGHSRSASHGSDDRARGPVVHDIPAGSRAPGSVHHESEGDGG